MSPGEGAAHIFKATRVMSGSFDESDQNDEKRIQTLRKQFNEAIPEEVLKALREALWPLERLENNFQEARTMIRKQVLAEFPEKKERSIMQRLAEENITVCQGQPTPGRIAWMVEGQEIMTFEPNGDILVKGRLVENDKEVVDGFREWFAKAKED